MANNFDKFVPQLLAQGLMTLREMAVMPALVNREYEALAGNAGTTIDVPVPSAITAVAVSPGATPPANTDSTESSVSIALDQWYEAPFFLTDKEQLQVMQGYIPRKASQAIRSLANNVDQYLLNLGKQFYGYVGTAGTTPFGTGVEILSATNVRKVLNNQLAPLDDRRLVFNADCEANMLALRAFHDASFGVGAGAILRGEIGPKLGFLNAMDQNVQTHTAGTADTLLVNNGAGYPVGTTTVATDGELSGTVLVGDIITFAGHSQTYVVTASVGGATPTSVSFQPGLVASVADNAAITLKATHVMNLGFHRDAIAFATRPLLRSSHPGAIVESAVDEVSGLTLRLEITRQHKQDRYSFDILYGANVVRRELGCRLAG